MSAQRLRIFRCFHSSMAYFGAAPHPELAAIPLVAVALSKILIVAAQRASAPRKAGEETEEGVQRRGQRLFQIIVLLIHGTSALALFLISAGQQEQQHKTIDAIFTIILWGPLTSLFKQWTRLVPPSWSQTMTSNNKNKSKNLVQGMMWGGPLGSGCGKLMEVLAACLLWTMVRGSPPESIAASFRWPFHLLFSSRQNQPTTMSTKDWTLLLFGVLLLSLAVNGVLAAWSHYYFNARCTNSRTNSGASDHPHHPGVQRMVQSTVGRRLSVPEHGRLVALAVLNAVCEECTSRGFWRREFELTAHLTGAAWHSNLAQAVVFGAWHYHGIPSGLTGVALTTVYGLLMGWLADWQPATGLLLPILTHSIADYYIFAVIARQPIRKKAD